MFSFYYIAPIHGSKHGSLKAKFVRPTVVLDHTSHLRAVDCSKPNQIEVCFSNQEAFDAARHSWNATDLTVVTFHVGCGDELSGKRSYFNTVGHVVTNQRTLCIAAHTKEVSHDEALESGEIRWGTYEDPENKKRMPALGHVRMAGPDDDEDPPPAEENSTDPSESVPTDDPPSEPGSDDDTGRQPDEANGQPEGANGQPDDTDGQSDLPSGEGDDPFEDADNDIWTQVLNDEFNNYTQKSGPTDDLNKNASALEHVFPYLAFDDSDMTSQAPADEDLQTIYSDGTVPTDESPDDNPDGGDPEFDDDRDTNAVSTDADEGTSGNGIMDDDNGASDEATSRRRAVSRRAVRTQHKEALSFRRDLSTHLEERFLDAIFNAIKAFIQVCQLDAPSSLQLQIRSNHSSRVLHHSSKHLSKSLLWSLWLSRRLPSLVASLSQQSLAFPSATHTTTISSLITSRMSMSTTSLLLFLAKRKV